MNVILRPVYNRPETLKISLEYNTVAINADNYYYVFCLDGLEGGGYDKENLKIIKDFLKKYKGEVVIRPCNFGLTKNILEGYKYCFDKTDEYVINIQDDLIMSNDFFKYMDYCYRHFYKNDIYTIAATASGDIGKLEEIKKVNGVFNEPILLSKYQFKKNIEQHCIENYYKDRVKYLKEQFPGVFIRADGKVLWTAQAGLLHRIKIKAGLLQILPLKSRVQNIGFYGTHFRKKSLEGNLEEKYNFLKKAMFNPTKYVTWHLADSIVNKVIDLVNEEWDDLTLI